MQISTWMFKVLSSCLLFLKVNADDFLKSSYVEKYQEWHTIPPPRGNIGDLWYLPLQMRGREREEENGGER